MNENFFLKNLKFNSLQLIFSYIKLSSILLFLASCTISHAFEAVSIRFAAGQVIEQVQTKPDQLIQSDLVPDQSFITALHPAPISRLRDFLNAQGPSLGLTSAQLTRIGQLALQDTVVKNDIKEIINTAERSLSVTSEPTTGSEPLSSISDFTTLQQSRRICAIAFALTGDEKYAASAWQALSQSIENFYQRGIIRINCDWTNPWDEADELYEAAFTWDLIAHWEGLRQTDGAIVYFYLRRLGTRLAYAVELSPVIGHQQAVWAGNLGTIATWAPSLPEAGHWLELVEGRLPGVLDDFMSDGGHIECTPLLHYMALQSLGRYYQQRIRVFPANPGILAQNHTTLNAALRWLPFIATPGGWLPSLNDSPPLFLGFEQSLSAITSIPGSSTSIDATQSKDPVQRLLSRCQPSKPYLKADSALLPDTGIAVLRNNTPDETMLLFDFGRHGGPHGHPDKLNIELYSHGKTWIVDAGWPSDLNAALEDGESWYRTTQAHNTVVLDNTSQLPVDGTLVQWISNTRWEVVVGQYQGYDKFTHRRTILHPQGSYFLLLDELGNWADYERQVDWMVHVTGERESGTAGRFLFWHETGEGLVIATARGSGIRKIQTGTGPCVLVQPENNQAVINPALPWLALQRSITPQNTGAIAVLLQPFTGIEPDCRAELSDFGDSLGIDVWAGRIHDRYLIRKWDRPAGTIIRGLGLVTDGNWALAREINGEVTILEVAGGDSLSVN